MKQGNVVRLIFAMTVVFLGCEGTQSPEISDQPLLSAVGRSQNPVLTFADLTEVGSSRLTRTAHGVSGSVTTTLEPGTATTMWMVVFNHPEHCIDGCDEPDLFVADVEGDVLYTAGHVIGGSGHATFAGHRSVGDANGSLFALFGLPSPGLIDASTAEIHFVMRTHGLAIPALLPDMIHTFNGGCGGLDASFGAPGPNTCTDIQFAVHQP